MANLQEVSNWESGVFQLETTTPAIGGPPDLAQGLGLMNVPAQQLANRTQFLKAATTPAALLAALLGVDGAGSGLDADMLDGKHASSFIDVSAFGASTRSFSPNGYQILPSGLIIQWGGAGSETGTPGVQERLFSIAFPNACLRPIAVDGAVSDTGTAHIISVRDFTTSSFRYLATSMNAVLATTVIHWLAVGY